MVRWVVPDFESQSACDLKAAGAYRYAVDPTTALLCCSFTFDDDQTILWWPDQPLPPRVLTAIEKGAMFVAHNAGFERNLWTHHMVAYHGAPEIPIEQWHDTQARAQQMALPGGLEKLLVALGMPTEKDKEGRALTLSFSKPDRKTGMLPVMTPAKRARIGQYCDSDTGSQTSVHRRLGWLPPHERPIWELSQRINDRGVPLDMDFVRAAQMIVDKATDPLAARFKVLTGGLNFGQIAKVKHWVNRHQVGALPSKLLDDLGAETVAALLKTSVDDSVEDDWAADGDADDANYGDHVELPPDVLEALHIRQLIGSSSIKKLKAMEACVGYDGRARGLFRYHGTTPGRQTAGLFQPHNFPRGTNETIGMDVDTKIDAIMTGDPEWVKAVTGVEPVELVVGSLRHAIRATQSKTGMSRVIMSGDYSGIQARTVLALAGQHDKTALMAAGADVYCDMAKDIYGREVTKADTAERQVGKNSVLGLGFQMGAKKFHWKYCDGLPMEFAQNVVDVYRKEWAPLVPSLWYGLQDAALQAVWTGEEQESHDILYRLVDRWLVAEIPNGSTIQYYDPQPVTRLMPWSTEDEPDYRKGFTYRVEKQGRLIMRDAFGGQLTENIVMKIEREMVENAKAKLEANGFPVIMEVHDEIVCEPLTRDLDAFKEIMEDVPRWVHEMQIPVHVDVWMGDRYRK
jgi:DNA polymerase